MVVLVSVVLRMRRSVGGKAVYGRPAYTSQLTQPRRPRNNMLPVLAITVLCIATWASALNDPLSGKSITWPIKTPLHHGQFIIPSERTKHFLSFFCLSSSSSIFFLAAFSNLVSLTFIRLSSASGSRTFANHSKRLTETCNQNERKRSFMFASVPEKCWYIYIYIYLRKINVFRARLYEGVQAFVFYGSRNDYRSPSLLKFGKDARQRSGMLDKHLRVFTCSLRG